jgi:hypothetical protein
LPKQTPIQIHVPKPCHEDWNKMTQTEKGKFCSSCQKEVIDFTNWSDAALYNFFSKKRKNKVCGHFYESQLNRVLTIPPQPGSKLYQMFVGLGLSLLFISSENVSAKDYTPIYTENPLYSAGTANYGSEMISIKGKAMDYDGNPVREVIIYLYQNDQIKKMVLTNRFGNYSFVSVQAGDYILKCDNLPNDIPVKVYNDTTITIDIKMSDRHLPLEVGGERCISGEEIDPPKTNFIKRLFNRKSK